MKTFKKALTVVAGAAIISGSTLVALPASAGDITCRTTLTNRTIDGNVNVPAGANCTLKGVTVDGNVKVNSNSYVNITGKSRIKGNVQAQGQRHVLVQGYSRVDGDVQAKSGNSAYVGVAYVDGNVQIEQNFGKITVGSSQIKGDVQLFSNRGRNSAYTKTVFNNRIGGNLQCKSNTPAPYGDNNRVEGNKEDQCRRL
ncbi:hypothetical protein [Ornithinimicrobium panacihumi]|uniref:hypothetical protein n=1 Tax=Ornithinimicrobium panacihumi TaxID=2008449 RepID=UPI003F8AE3B0